MFSANDPRTSLPARSRPTSSELPIAAPQYFDLANVAVSETTAWASRSWQLRAQNFSLLYTNPAVGDMFQFHCDEESMIVLTAPDSALSVTAGSDTRSVAGLGVIVVPPGATSVVSDGPGGFVRLSDSRDRHALDRAVNADAYAEPDLRVTPLKPWPSPAHGRALRAYRVADFPPTDGRFGTIFRTSSFMVNFLDTQKGPRDPDALSPHHHDDFEQVSLTVEGEWVHHIRTPWGPRSSWWRPDEHRTIGSPAVAIIPPPNVHTSEATGAGINRIIDIFSPPRADFSARDGWVLNAADYPVPDVKR